MKSFLRGIGSVISLFPSEGDLVLLTNKHSDVDAIANDWKKIGNDMRCVVEKSHQQEIQQKNHE